MASVRLPLKIEQKLEIISQRKNKTKSDIIREALENYFAANANEKSAYEIGCGYFGKYGSGDGTLSTTYKNKVKNKIKEKLHDEKYSD